MLIGYPAHGHKILEGREAVRNRQGALQRPPAAGSWQSSALKLDSLKFRKSCRRIPGHWPVQLEARR
jgi:hypothetical protein